MNRRCVASRIALWGMCALALAAVRPARAEGPLFPEKSLRGLATAARKIAREGRGPIAADLLDATRALGYPDARIAKLRTECERLAGKAKANRPASALTRVAKDVGRSVRSLASALSGLPEVDRARAAAILLRLDGACEEAHRALGHRRVDEAWMTEEEWKRRARRLGFREVLRAARTQTVELTIDQATDPTVEVVTGSKGHRLVSDRFEVHSALPLPRLERIVRESVRASVVANWLLTGRAAPPRMNSRCRYILFRTKAEYRRALAEELRRKLISRERYERGLETGGTHILDPSVALGTRKVTYSYTEADAESDCMIARLGETPVGKIRFFTDQFVQAGLRAGLLNLVSLAYIGCGMPSRTWSSREGEAGRQSTTERKIPEEFIHFPKAGLVGNRRYAAWLARERRDPPWIRSFQDQIGKIGGDELIKTTIVVEFLAESGNLLPLFEKTAVEKTRGREIVRVLEDALAEPLDRLEERWRDWITSGTTSSILGRLTGGDRTEKPLSAETKKALAYLDRQRARAGLDPVRYDPGLSEDANRHAVYLTRNPDQAAKWPDAHEEYPDRPGFSPEGSWAGLHSVIAPGSESVEAAVDAWLGTFYHRLPLLEPGLLAVGWGCHERMVVMDAGSLVAEPEFATEVRWPPAGAKGVPRRFRPELPNPVPGEDQSRWGYPVTLQLRTDSGEDLLDVEMTLHEGRRGGAVVPCHLSTPERPTNPEMAPANAYCLIPKSHLGPGTKYVVVAKVVSPPIEIVWEFTTGR